ncbi:MAG: orotidine-5'-phosphate decarboxylase [Gammaproteobacteria bacterium]|nr:orotidine-5'-phosphate decarboxylase [Gammaproteobacteria bacterium]
MIQNDKSKKIIIALDYDNKESVINLCDQLDPSFCRVKIGKQLFTKLGPSIIDIIHKKNFEIFLDLKFHDIPVTVYKACIEAYKLGIWMLNIHLLGGEEMIKAAKEARDKENPSALIVGVSLLTSHNDKSLEYIGLKNRITAVKNLAILAEKCSIDGIVCSPSDISNIKDSVSNLIYVTPGIRLNDDNDDHVRIYTPKKALSLGSDYLVIGRPITEAKEPMDVVKKIISTI